MTRVDTRIATGCLAAALVLAGTLAARDLPEPGMPVSVIVTASGQKDAPAPHLTVDDVLVSQNKERMPVTGLEPLRSENGLQLWVLIDDGAGSSLGTQLADLKKFVMAQPASMQIGIGYMRNGMVQQAQPLTADHEAAARALRLPTAVPGISASPYVALTSLIHNWPAGAAAREVLMVSDGVDPIYGAGPDDPYLNESIDAAQRAGVVVYSIYYSGSGRFARSFPGHFWGQNYLAQLTEQTGGELYWLGYSNPVSMAPYLEDVSRRLNSQYQLTFLARPGNKAEFQNVKVSAEHPHVKVTGPDKVYVPVSR